MGELDFRFHDQELWEEEWKRKEGKHLEKEKRENICWRKLYILRRWEIRRRKRRNEWWKENILCGREKRSKNTLINRSYKRRYIEKQMFIAKNAIQKIFAKQGYFQCQIKTVFFFRFLNRGNLLFLHWLGEFLSQDVLVWNYLPHPAQIIFVAAVKRPASCPGTARDNGHHSFPKN